MWARMVYQAKVGPEPCPVKDLTAEILAEKFSELTSEETGMRAKLLAVSMSKEDGVECGVDHFLESLPTDHLCCDVALIMGEAQAGRFRVLNKEVKVGYEVAAILIIPPEARPGCLKRLTNALRCGMTRLERYNVVTYALGNPKTACRGLASGCSGCFAYLLYSPTYFFSKTYKYAKRYGVGGALYGLLLAPFYVAWAVLYAPLVLFVDRFLIGILNGCCGRKILYAIDRSVLRSHRTYNPGPILEEVRSNSSPPSEARRDQLRDALDIAMAANRIYDRCEPHFRGDHWHWKVAAANELCSHVARLSLLDEEEVSSLTNFLEREGEGEISFSRFCLLIGEATKQRFSPAQDVLSRV